VTGGTTAAPVLLLNRDTGQIEQELSVGKPLSRPTAGSPQLIYRQDGQHIALAGQQRAVIWDLATGQEIARWEPDPMVAEELTSAAFASDGHLLASGLVTQRTAVVWRVATKERVWQAPKDYMQARLSQDGGLIAVVERFAASRAAPQFSIVTLETANGSKSPDHDAPASLSDSPLFSNDRQWIAALGGTRSLGAVRISSGQVMGGANAHVLVWNAAEGGQPWEIRGPEAPTSCVFSPDSQTLAVGFRDGAAQLWNLNRKELLFTWKEHATPLMHLAFSEDGSEIASAETNAANAFAQIKFLNLKGLRQQLATYGLDW
jgi:WD40 repeat protein